MRNKQIASISLTVFAVAMYLCTVPAVKAQVSVASDVSACTSLPAAGVIMKRVTYYENTNPSPNDLRSSVIGDQFVIRLKGWLYFEAGKKQKNEKVIIYNHGHNDGRVEPCALVKYFVDKGFVVFAPLRRGHFANTPNTIPLGWQSISSTGVFTDDYVDNCQAGGNCGCSIRGIHIPAGSCDYNMLEVDYIRQQVIDVREQITYIKNHASINADGTPGSGKLAEAKYIAILGHSYGGSLVTFANAELDGQNVAISVCGAELSWGDEEPAWESELGWAMEDQQSPIYFLQPKNGRTLAPMKSLFGIAIDKKYRSQAAVFPPTAWDPNLPDPDNPGETLPEFEQAHDNFISDTAEIEKWGKTVKEFIERYPK